MAGNQYFTEADIQKLREIGYSKTIYRTGGWSSGLCVRITSQSNVVINSLTLSDLIVGCFKAQLMAWNVVHCSRLKYGYDEKFQFAHSVFIVDCRISIGRGIGN